MKNKNNYWLLALSIAAAEVIGVVGSLFTYPNITSWYSTLTKPNFTPPNWLFGPVWTLLYLLMGIAAWLVWRQYKKHRPDVMAIYGFQLALNLLWSIVFFGWQRIDLGLLVIIILWLMIVATIVAFWKHSRWASVLLLPYIAWVSFAMLLNFALWQLN